MIRFFKKIKYRLFGKDISFERFLELTQLKYNENEFRYENPFGSWIEEGIVRDAQKRKDLRGLASELLRK